MKKSLIIILLVALGCMASAQRQKVSVGKDGEMIVNGDTIAYIEKEGCKLLSPECIHMVTNEDDEVLVTLTFRCFDDKSQISEHFPNGTRECYLSVSFKGFDGTGEVDFGSIPTTERVAKLVARWRLIRDGALDAAAVEQFLNANPPLFSEKERLQNAPPAIQIINVR